LQDAASWLQAAKQQQQQHQQPVVQHPRCARVNTLKATVQQVLAQLQAEGFEPHSSSAGGSSGSGPSVRVDGLLPDLLVFPAGTDLHDHQLVEQGVLILQV
jgi:putative methyltransferase